MRRNAITAIITLSIVLASVGVAAAIATDDPARSEATSPALDDATIVAIFDAANTADMETGALAAERGASKEVREYGAMLVRDHEHVRKLGRDLAAKLKVTPTPPKDDASAKQHAAAMKRLSALSGEQFDRAFLLHEVAFHKGVIDAINSTLMPAIKNAELKALVVQVAPAFEAHMLAAQNMEGKLAGSKDR